MHHASPSEKTCWIKKKPFSDEKGAIEFLKKWITNIEKDREAIEQNPADYREKYHDSFLKTQALIGDTVNLFAQQGVGLDDIRVRLGFEIFSYVYADDPGIVSEFLEQYTRRNIVICHAIADISLSSCVLTYGDICLQTKTLA
ncbi:MAG: hypothetical protein ACP5JO_00920 [Candidatus Ratteibacteria bacterium]